MDNVNNQNGAALVIVLFLIVIISIFSMTLFSSSYNNTLQHKKIEETAQLKELVTMGMMNLREEIIFFLNDESIEVDNFEDKVLEIASWKPIVIEFNSTKNIRYTVKVEISNVSPINDDDYLITYTSNATIKGSSKETKGTITIEVNKTVTDEGTKLEWFLEGN